MKKKLLSCLLVLPSLALGPTLLASPASASASDGTTSSSSGVLYDSCVDHRYRYSVHPAGTDWNLDVDLVGPDGSVVGSDYLYRGGNATSGRSSFLFCGYEDAGRYRIRATLTSYDADYNAHTANLASSTFTMRRPHTRTALSVSKKHPKFNRVVTFRTRSKVEKPAGFFALKYEYARLQIKVKGTWHNLRGSKEWGNSRGKTSQKWRWNIRGIHKVRAQTIGADGFTRSFSKPVKIKAKRGGSGSRVGVYSLIE